MHSQWRLTVWRSVPPPVEAWRSPVNHPGVIDSWRSLDIKQLFINRDKTNNWLPTGRGAFCTEGFRGPISRLAVCVCVLVLLRFWGNYRYWMAGIRGPAVLWGLTSQPGRFSLFKTRNWNCSQIRGNSGPPTRCWLIRKQTFWTKITLQTRLLHDLHKAFTYFMSRLHCRE